MKNLVILFAHTDNKSYFRDQSILYDTTEPLGFYSQLFNVHSMRFRTFKKGSVFDWHPAPQSQYIIYLEGEVEVEASGGETRIFRKNDILFATDTCGQGHITRTLTSGRSIIITAAEFITY